MFCTQMLLDFCRPLVRFVSLMLPVTPLIKSPPTPLYAHISVEFDADSLNYHNALRTHTWQQVQVSNS